MVFYDNSYLACLPRCGVLNLQPHQYVQENKRCFLSLQGYRDFLHEISTRNQYISYIFGHLIRNKNKKANKYFQCLCVCVCVCVRVCDLYNKYYNLSSVYIWLCSSYSDGCSSVICYSSGTELVYLFV